MIKIEWQRALMPLTASLVGASGVIFAGYITANTENAIARRDNEIRQLELANVRIEALEMSNRELTNEIAKLRSQVTMLRTQIEFEIAPTELFFQFLEGLEDSPSWVKVWDEEDDSFKMLYINRAYEFFYDVTRERYIGASDSEVHPADVAQAFAENDQQVFIHRDRQRVTETVMLPNGERKEYDFWKIFLRLPDQRAAIVGIQIGPTK